MLRCARQMALGALLLLTPGCASNPHDLDTDALLTTFSGQAGAGDKLYYLSLTFDSVGATAVGSWDLAYQTTCQTQNGLLHGSVKGATIRVTLEADEMTEASFQFRLTQAADGTLRGHALEAQAGSNPLCFTTYPDITLYPIDRLPPASQ